MRCAGRGLLLAAWLTAVVALQWNELKYTNKAAEAVNNAGRAAMTNGQSSFGAAHLAALLFSQGQKGEESIGAKVAAHAGADAELVIKNLKKVSDKEAPKQKPSPTASHPTTDLKRALLNADQLRDDNSDGFIGTHHLLLACAGSDNVKKALSASGLSSGKLNEAVRKLRGNKKTDKPTAEDTFEVLAKYGRDLVEMAESGKLDPVIGRDDEIRRVVQVRPPQLLFHSRAFGIGQALLLRKRLRACKLTLSVSRLSVLNAPSFTHAGPQPADQEQPRAARRTGRGQDRHRRGPGAANPPRRRPAVAARLPRGGARHGRRPASPRRLPGPATAVFGC
jgi:hypothetical protein